MSHRNQLILDSVTLFFLPEGLSKQIYDLSCESGENVSPVTFQKLAKSHELLHSGVLY